MMLKKEQIDQVEPTIKTSKTISYALIIGVLAATICLGAIANWDNVNSALDILPIVGIAIGVSHLFLAIFVPTLLVQNQLQNIQSMDEELRLKS